MATIISTKTSGVGGLEVTGDATGILQLASNNGTTAVTVDASQNVGIGTTNPANKLAVVSTGDRPLLAQSGTDTPAVFKSTISNAYIQIGNSSFDTYIGAVGSNQTFTVNGAERMRLDSNGILTKPYQPSFTGWRTSGNVTGVNVVLHNNIITNVGSYYNASNGRFTCPVAGKYLVICNGHAENSQPSNQAIYKNGSSVCYEYQGGSAYGAAAQSAILDCAANDYIQHYVGNGTFWGGDNSGLRMTITLIG